MSATAGELCAVPVESFHIGLQLPFNIHDQHGVLLLKRGSVVTPRFIAQLNERKLSEVYLAKQDMKAIKPPAAAESREAGAIEMETDQSRSLDALDFDDRVEAGKALIESFRPRTAVPYDTELVNQLVSVGEQSVCELSSQLSELVEGSNKMPGRCIEKMTTTYIWSMAQDLDATLSVSQLQQKGTYLANHSLQMSIMGMALAAQMELPEAEVRIAGIAGLIHDLGMAKAPPELVDAPRLLSRLEFMEIMKHPIHTLDLTDRVLGIPNRCRLIVYQVHERQNGKGYPRGRNGAKTYNIAKILGIVDSYLAMICDRPHRRALLPYGSMEHILKESRAGLWDPKVVRAFLSLLGLFPVGSFVMLADGAIAKVIRSGGNNFAKPHITITHNADGIPQKGGAVIDLAQETKDNLRIVKAVPPVFEYAD